jgi:hypothetical protein
MSTATFTVNVETRGEIPEVTCRLARASIEDLNHDSGLLIRQARIKLSSLTDPALPHPAVIQGNLDIGGIPMRAQTAAHTMGEAVHLLHERLRDHVGRLLRDDAPYGGIALSAPRQPVHQRAEADAYSGHRSRIVRRKLVTLRRETVDEAAFRMDAMDYDCHLFSDADTGQDSMVFRSGPTGYSLAQLTARTGPPRRRNLRVTVRPLPAPRLTHDQAAARLNLTGLPFLFFADAGSATSRGALIYERYDGHYALLLSRP